jgi:diaminopimelate decarboxylase
VGSGILDSQLADAGLARRPDGSLACGAISLHDIAEAVGTPTFVYDAAAIRSRYRELAAALTGLPARICYAVKANGNLAVLRVLAEMGAGADIVSGGELLRALTAGFPAEHIVFSGVGKTDEELLAAIAAGIGSINVESLAELQRLAQLAALHEADVPVGIRINPDVTTETHPHIATGKGGLKFGVPVDQFTRCLEVLDEAPRLRLGGLAMHIGSQLFHSGPYRDGLGRLLELLQVARDAGFEPHTLDIGGGFGVRYRDESPLTPEEWLAPLRADLAGSGCSVHLEPGRFLVANAGMLLTRIVHRKHSGGREIAVVDAGMNDLLRPVLYGAWHGIVPVDDRQGMPAPIDVVGPVCETGDFIALGRNLPPLTAGDLLAVLGTGAYGFAMSSNYNARPRAAEVLLDGNRWAVVRPRERLAELFRTEVCDPFGPEAS